MERDIESSGTETDGQNPYVDNVASAAMIWWV